MRIREDQLYWDAYEKRQFLVVLGNLRTAVKLGKDRYAPIVNAMESVADDFRDRDK